MDALPEFLVFTLVGTAAQLVDGALGMAYGVTAAGLLLGLGLPPVMASASVHYAETFSREADVGMVGVNIGICAPHPYLPFGGIKGSLIGTNKVQGKDALDFFTQNKVVTVRTYHPDPAMRGGKAKPANASVRSCVAS